MKLQKPPLLHLSCNVSANSRGHSSRTKFVLVTTLTLNAWSGRKNSKKYIIRVFQYLKLHPAGYFLPASEPQLQRCNFHGMGKSLRWKLNTLMQQLLSSVRFTTNPLLVISNTPRKCKTEKKLKKRSSLKKQ